MPSLHQPDYRDLVIEELADSAAECEALLVRVLAESGTYRELFLTCLAALQDARVGMEKLRAQRRELADERRALADELRRYTAAHVGRPVAGGSSSPKLVHHLSRNVQ